MEKYTELGLVGKGGFGEVKLVELKDNPEVTYVIKTVTGLKHKEDQEESEHEVRMLQGLQSRFTIGYIESFKVPNGICIVQEYAENGTLAEHIKEWKAGRRPSEEGLLDAFVQLVLALNYLHKQKVIHRDLKPANVFIARGDIVKLGDFGLARTLSKHTVVAMTRCGTANYISPEVVEGRPYDVQADMWALGCILYEIHALRRAFDHPAPGKLALLIASGEYNPIQPWEANSPHVRKLCDSLLAYNPKHRPNTDAVLALPFIASARGALEARLVMAANSEAPAQRPMFAPLQAGLGTFAGCRLATLMSVSDESDVYNSDNGLSAGPMHSLALEDLDLPGSNYPHTGSLSDISTEGKDQ
mmetsp:Transcript_7429/g.8576  ORF Transcript_7429/g.8576 Transcript_7429/m.8576 type:complete len:358 (+) Transcript_7429:453-1526(+)